MSFSNLFKKALVQKRSLRLNFEVCLTKVMDKALYFVERPTDLTWRTTEYVHTQFGNAILKFLFLYISFCYKHQPMQQTERIIV